MTTREDTTEILGGRCPDVTSPSESGRGDNRMTTTAAARAHVMRRLVQAALTCDRDVMADLVTADVTAWSSSLFVTSRDDLLAALERRDDALSGVDIEVRVCAFRTYSDDLAVIDQALADP